MVKEEKQSWTGRSDEIAVPLLSAEFWKEGTEVDGVLDSRREQKMGGMAYRIVLNSAIALDGEDVSIVELPSLTGVKNALEALRTKGYQLKKGDMWHIECVGIRKSKKEEFSDSPEFQIDVIRKSAAAAA